MGEYLSMAEAEDMYDDMIDEVSGEVKIGSLTYIASEVLRRIDPIAYDCGFNDYLDSLFEDYTITE
jgi:hypothetical protein